MKKKLSVLYAVVACITLAITTIGATYAYWTASTASISSDLKTESITYSISMEIKPIPSYTGFSFIPMNDEDALKAIKNKCKDKYDRGACSAYNIRVFGYSNDLNYISGTIEFLTDNMENLSYMVLEEKNNSQEENCVIIEEKNFCLSKEATRMVKEESQSIGDTYDVTGLEEKNLLLVIWLSNLQQNQNTTDIGNFNATVTIFAGSGGEIKGTIASAVQIDPNIDNNTPDGNENP